MTHATWRCECGKSHPYVPGQDPVCPDKNKNIEPISARGESEKIWQARVINLAIDGGWMHYHTYDSRRCVPGFPDLVLLNPRVGRMLVAELKVKGGRVTPQQREWLDAFAKCGCESYVWYPHNWDEVVKTLLN